MSYNRRTIRHRRYDGYVNLMSRWRSIRDPSETYRFQREMVTPDAELTTLYTDNGLFTRIIDAPAEEALKQGFDLGLNNPEIEKFILQSLDDLRWSEHAATAIKWARLYGGAIIVMLIDDGGGLEEPLRWKHIRSIDELHVFERPIVYPDYSSLYASDIRNYRGHRRGGGFLQPQFYDVSSIYGSFRVHESRCLVFRNGTVPEGVHSENYRYWGTPEYTRIKRALQDTITAHSNGPKLLEKSVQAVYKMKDLASLMATEMGEEQALKRLELIDLARGFLNSIAIDANGEDYSFQTFQFSGVKDVIDATCNMLSALTNIPQTILFGRSPAGENATGKSDMENWYSFIGRLQQLSLKPNLLRLLDILFTAGKAGGQISEEPDYDLKFKPLWSLSDTEQATVDKTKADTAYVKAQTAQLYVGMQALDPSEVRTALADSEEFNVEEILDDIPPEELILEPQGPPATDVPSSQSPITEPSTANLDSVSRRSRTDDLSASGVGVLVVGNGNFLVGLRRKDGTYSGPGGHVEPGETAEQAALQVTREKFGITPTELIPIGNVDWMSGSYRPFFLFLCTDYEGTPTADGAEMQFARFMPPVQVQALTDAGVAFLPFAESVQFLYSTCLLTPGTQTGIIGMLSVHSDGGPGSGNHGHKGIPGQIGGSAPSGSSGSAPKTGSSSGTKSGSPVKGAASGGKGTEKSGTSVGAAPDSRSSSASGKAGESGKSTTGDKPGGETPSKKPQAKFTRSGNTITTTKKISVKFGNGYAQLPADSVITDISDFAGAGCKNPLREADHLAAMYGGDAKDWVHSLGYSTVTTKGKMYDVELHWFENSSIGQTGMKVKRRIKKGGQQT